MKRILWMGPSCPLGLPALIPHKKKKYVKRIIVKRSACKLVHLVSLAFKDNSLIRLKLLVIENICYI